MSKIELEQQKNEKFAQENGISLEEMENIFQEIYNEMPDDLNETTKTLRSLRKTRGSLKRLVQSGTRVDGFILMRFPNKEYNLYAWNEVDRIVKEHGIEAAKAQGMADDKGNYLHTKGFNKGKVIDKNDIYGGAVGIFQQGEKVVPRELSIGSYAMDKVLPVCKEATFTLKEGKKASLIAKGSKIQYFNNAIVTDDTNEYTDPQVDVYLQYVKQFFGDIVFDDLADLTEYLKSKNFDRTAFGVVQGECLFIDPKKDPEKDINVNFEIGDVSEDFWVHPIEMEGLNITDGVAGYLFINALKKKDGSIKYHLGGFLPITEEGE